MIILQVLQIEQINLGTSKTPLCYSVFWVFLISLWIGQISFLAILRTHLLRHVPRVGCHLFAISRVVQVVLPGPGSQSESALVKVQQPPRHIFLVQRHVNIDEHVNGAGTANIDEQFGQIEPFQGTRFMRV